MSILLETKNKIKLQPEAQPRGGCWCQPMFIKKLGLVLGMPLHEEDFTWCKTHQNNLIFKKNLMPGRYPLEYHNKN
jgi:hypothetical protein